MTRIHRLYGSLLSRKRVSDVNIVDDLDSLKNTKELSRENRYPEGEEPDSQSLFPELDHGRFRHHEGEEDQEIDKEAIGLIEGPAIDENKYGTDYGRADSAIPRDPAKKDLLRASKSAQAYLSGFPYEAIVSIRVQSKRDNSVESGTSILEIDVIDGATVSLAAKHPRLNIRYEQVVSVKDLQYMLGNNLIGINGRYGDAYMNIIRPDRTEDILVWLDEALQSM